MFKTFSAHSSQWAASEEQRGQVRTELAQLEAQANTLNRRAHADFNAVKNRV